MLQLAPATAIALVMHAGRLDASAAAFVYCEHVRASESAMRHQLHVGNVPWRRSRHKYR